MLDDGEASLFNTPIQEICLSCGRQNKSVIPHIRYVQNDNVSEDNCPMSFRTDAKPSAVQNTLVRAQPRREGGKQG